MTGTVKISDRQLEIIEAAGKILTASGVSGLTIKNLAKEMKFSESAIYRHFTSKEEIIIALLEFLAKSMDERYSRAISSEQSPEEKFTTLFQNQFSFFKKNPQRGSASDKPDSKPANGSSRTRPKNNPQGKKKPN